MQDPWSGQIPHATEQQGPSPTTAEAHAPRAYALQQGKPLQWEAHVPQLESRPRSLQQEEESLRSNEDPAQSKIN